MDYRNLGKAGLKVSVLGMGSYPFGASVAEKETECVVHHALSLGINFFDTADAYSDGLSEELLGKALKGRRSDVIIATKFGNLGWGNHRPISKDPNGRGASRYHIMNAVEGSLRRLQTDHIDLYQVHRPDPGTPIEETLRTLNDLVRSGKVRYIGCSNVTAQQMTQSLEVSRALGLESFVTTQELYNLIDRDIEKELTPSLKAHGVGLIPYRPLRGGFLTGKYKRGQGLPPGSRYDVSPELMTEDRRKALSADHFFDILERLESFAGQRGHTIAELAVAWLLAHPSICSVIAGSSHTEQTEANIKGAEWKLAPEEFRQVDMIGMPGTTKPAGPGV